MKTLLIALTATSILTLVVVSVSNAQTTPTLHQIWNVVLKLQQKLITLSQTVANIQLIPGPQGPAGPQGPIGPQGPQATLGAGNIAFIIQADEVLRTDGTVWLWASCSPNPPCWILNPNVPPVPIPVSSIVDFTAHNFLDSNGNVWRLNNNVWTNLGHP